MAFHEYFRENWVWDRNSKPAEVQLSADQEEAYFLFDPVIESTGTVGKLCVFYLFPEIDYTIFNPSVL